MTLRLGAAEAQAPVIGIPRSLLFHKYGILWRGFLEGLGCEVVVSPPTNAAILDAGCRLAPDEACLPVKLHVGHVEWLLSRVDHVLLPRIVSLRAREENCVKFMGSCDMVAAVLGDADLLAFTVDVRNGRREGPEMVALAAELGAGRARAWLAYLAAKRRQRVTDRSIARAALARLRSNRSAPTTLVVSHPYNLHDAYLGEPLTKLLAEQGVEAVSADALVPLLGRGPTSLARDLYWTYSRELLVVMERLRAEIDAVLFVTSFPCGPDSLVYELCRRRVRDVPMATIVIDESAADAGLRTRIECFADIVKARHAERTAPAADAVPAYAGSGGGR